MIDDKIRMGILVLHLHAKYSYKELAKFVNKCPSTIRSWASYARKHGYKGNELGYSFKLEQ